MLLGQRSLDSRALQNTPGIGSHMRPAGARSFHSARPAAQHKSVCVNDGIISSGQPGTGLPSKMGIKNVEVASNGRFSAGPQLALRGFAQVPLPRMQIVRECRLQAGRKPQKPSVSVRPLGTPGNGIRPACG